MIEANLSAKGAAIVTQEGIVFDMQRFSIHDGPGIRTLVFLKGCPLHCKWCSNPESQRFRPELLFQPEKCIGCQACLEICPHQAVSLDEGQLAFHRDLCQECGACCQVCYAEARIVKGTSMTVDQVLEEVLKDAAFYANSGGGMTLGGGEPLAQADFAAAILQAAKAKEVHTAVETAGHVPWDNFEKVLPYTDLFLYDLKHMDPKTHRQWIGQNNQLILSNLERLRQRTRNIILRTPVIPGFNDNEADIAAIARQGRLLGIHELHLLPFHRFGEGKYRLLDRERFQPVRNEIPKEEMEAFKIRAEKEGLRVQIGG